MLTMPDGEALSIEEARVLGIYGMNAWNGTKNFFATRVRTPSCMCVYMYIYERLEWNPKFLCYQLKDSFMYVCMYVYACVYMYMLGMYSMKAQNGSMK
jgi:hypothetical protein